MLTGNLGNSNIPKSILALISCFFGFLYAKIWCFSFTPWVFLHIPQKRYVPALFIWGRRAGSGNPPCNLTTLEGHTLSLVDAQGFQFLRSANFWGTPALKPLRII